MLAYIPYMDPMGFSNLKHWFFREYGELHRNKHFPSTTSGIAMGCASRVPGYHSHGTQSYMEFSTK